MNSTTKDPKFEQKIIGNKYKLIRKLGKGSYGCVYECMDIKTTKRFAIKKIDDIESNSDVKRVIREIMVLKAFQHENLLAVKAIHLEEKDKFFNVWLVTDLMDFDMFKVIRKGRNELTEEHIQYIMYQIFLGMYVLHQNNIVHRDIKPNNILLNDSCDLKICDFGFAREVQMEPGADITEYVVTRYYRAPEIMLNSRKYGTEVDIWSVGCTFFELLDCKILFGGTKNYIQLLDKIIRLLGSPSDEALEFIQNENARMWIKKQKYSPNQKPSDKLTTKGINHHAKDLLNKCLVFDPRTRITAKEALMHPYFADLFSEQDLNVLEMEFDFSFENNPKLTTEQLKEKFMKEVKSMLI
jgi:mitogen-activated protein kinase 1/3